MVKVAVRALINLVSRRSCTEEAILGITVIDGEHKLLVLPRNGTIEVLHLHVILVLDGREHKLQLVVTTGPEGAEDVIIHFKTHDVVHVDFKHGIILVIAQSEFVGHLVGQEERLVTGRLVTHRIGGRT